FGVVMLAVKVAAYSFRCQLDIPSWKMNTTRTCRCWVGVEAVGSDSTVAGVEAVALGSTVAGVSFLVGIYSPQC
ncbi:hypothetical protein TNCV_1326851, partial [Trichonephila clavipes]